MKFGLYPDSLDTKRPQPVGIGRERFG